ncbi:MAG TPA: cytochrome P450 [Acidimicrobiales bacterium]|nr:cytochrome P450 [Acidimicrobiales bacterium]
MTERATTDFDHHSREFHAERHERWAELRQCPVAHNPRYGGFWVVSGYPEVAAVSRDAETYSSLYLPEPVDGIDYIGITGVPRASHLPKVGIAEVEGPYHRSLRRVLNGHLVPAAINRLEPLMRSAATWFLDQRIEDGEMDLVLDYTSPVPALLTMVLVGLPPDNWQHYAEMFHGTIAYRPGSDEHRRSVANLPAMVGELQGLIADRRQKGNGDLITELIEAEVDDDTPGERRHLTDDELVAVLWNVIGGGLDTTTSLTSLALHHLDEHPDLRQRLIDEPDLIGPATEEFLRFFSVNETLTRTVTRDVELGGQQLGPGDHLMISWLSANRDPAVFACPDDVVLDREANPHLAFGVGPHRCIGSHMARTLFQVLLREVLTRIPDYAVDRGATRFYQGNPELNGVVRMPARFTPGARTGPDQPPF